MPHPESGEILRLFEESRGKEALFQTQRDYTAQQRWVEEQVLSLGAKVHLIPASTAKFPQGQLESAGVDPLYGDILDPEFVDGPGNLDQRKLNASCLVEHEPSKQLLKKYGVDEAKDCIFHFPTSLLGKLGLITYKRFRGVDIGDLVIWDNTWYIVQSSHRGAFFGNTNNPYFTSAFADRYRHNSVPTERVANDCPEERE